MQIGLKTDKLRRKDNQITNQTNRLYEQGGDLSFKGRFSNVNKYIEDAGSDVGVGFKSMLKSALTQANEHSAKSGLKYNEASGELEINTKGVAGRTGEILLYPFKNFMLDIANATFEKIGLKKLSESGILRQRAIEHENIANVSVIENYITKADELAKKKAALLKLKEETQDAAGQAKIAEKIKNLEKDYKNSLLETSVGSFDPLKGNYDGTVERGLTRLVTGAIPAFFLANDAYNLSMFVTNDKQKSKDAQKRRFVQELARIGLTAGATYGVLKIFSKSSNKSASATAWIIAAVTFASEVVGRQMVGTPVAPLSDKKAKKLYAEREELRIKAANARGLSLENISKNSNTTKEEDDKQSKKKSLLTTKNILKVLGGLVVLGFVQDKAFQTQTVKKLTSKFNNWYKNLLQTDKTITVKHFDEMITKLKEVGLDKHAEKYEKLKTKIIEDGNLTEAQKFLFDTKVEEQVSKKLSEKFSADDLKALSKDELESHKKHFKDGVNRKAILEELNIHNNSEVLNLGKVDHKWKNAIIDQIIFFPVKYIWTIASAPYYKIVKPMAGFIGDAEKAKSPKKDATMKNLINLIDSYNKIKDKPDVNDRLLKRAFSSFNTETKSDISNANLSSLIKNVASTTTSAFLVIDNYNQVMVDSQGENKNLAEQKAKERSLQRLIRIIYGAFIIKLCNNLFAGPYNGSLLGAQTVNAAQTCVIETLERKSVGMPLGMHNKDEIVKIENKNLQATGLKGAYFRAMSELTGKKPISVKSQRLKKTQPSQ